MIENEWEVASTNFSVTTGPDVDTYEILSFTALPDGWMNLSHDRSLMSPCPGILKVYYPANEFDGEIVRYEAAAFGERGLEPAWKVHEGHYWMSTCRVTTY